MRYLSGVFAILLFSVQFIITGCEPTEKERPNIVLILIDDYGYGDISFEGNSQISTPSIDQIANEGIQFSNFYQSAAACAPTRASLLTGRYHLRTGVWGVHWGRDYLATEERTFADLAKKAGYVTGSFGKWHSGKSAGYHSWDRGFDVGLESNLYQYFNTNVLFNNKVVNIDGPITTVITDQAIQFLEDNRDSSFLCYLPYQAIHEPFNCPDEQFQKYKSKGYSDHVARLYGMIEVLDWNIGRLLSRLNELDLDKNTLVMFMVDDGSSPGFDLTYATRRMNETEKQERSRAWAKELRGTKANIWEGGVKSPFYLRWKGTLEPGKKIDMLSGVIDIYPTLAEICGFELPEQGFPVDGVSLAPYLLNGEAPPEDRYYFDNTNLYQIPVDKLDMEAPEIREMSVRYQNFKMVRMNHKLYGTDSISYHLFDLSQDEMENNNIYDLQTDIASQLKDTLEGWFKDVSASQNAFKACTFKLGSPNERATYINLDAFAKKSGSLERDTGPGFEISNWDTPGNTLSYHIDVLEKGSYFVEIIIEAEPDDLGGSIAVFTESDTALVMIDNEKKIKSSMLELQPGDQTLNVSLLSVGGSPKAMNWMKHIIVHRVPGEEENSLIKRPVLRAVVPSTGEVRAAEISRPAFESCTNPSIQGATLKVKAGEPFILEFFTENSDQVSRIDLYLNFDKIYTSSGFEKDYNLSIEDEGMYTVNAEFTSHEGYTCSSQLNIQVKK